jgi:phage tail sheath protein FI
MAASYLHGVGFVEVFRGGRPFNIPRTAVIGLVGTAPIQNIAAADRRLNRPVVISNMRDATKYFGEAKDSTGYTIPKALEAISAQGGALVVVINVFDPATHRTLGASIASGGNQSVTSNVATITTGAAHGLVVGDFVNISGFTGGLVALNQDYVKVSAVTSTTFTFDTTSANITATASTDGSVRKITFTPSSVNATTIIGGTTSTGERYGMEAFKDVQSLYDYQPKILIAPSYSPLAGVRAAMITLADNLKAIAIADMPAGASFQDAKTSRGDSGPFNYNTASPRLLITYPYVKVYDKATDTEEIQPFSQFIAGVIAYSDQTRGWWFSPSNVEIKGITGRELPLTSNLEDPQSETNQLNEVGITTLFSRFGTGIRTFGNRSAMWPSDAHPKNFINIQRIKDVTEDVIARNMLPFLDQPISDALIDSIIDSVTAFFNGLITQGALTKGSRCYINPDNNPADQLALGHLRFSLDFMGPTPAERFTYDVFINQELLRNALPQTA